MTMLRQPGKPRLSQRVGAACAVITYGLVHAA
jgi:hypothetical protein